LPNGIAELHMFSMIAEGTERSGPGGSVPLLPINGKDKDNRTKEEHHKLMNGNSGDSPDWVCDRTCWLPLNSLLVHYSLFQNSYFFT